MMSRLNVDASSHPIRVGQQLAAGHVEGGQRHDPADAVTGTRFLQLDSSLANDLELDRFSVDVEHGPDAVMIGRDGTQSRDRELGQSFESLRSTYLLAKRGISTTIGDEQVDVP